MTGVGSEKRGRVEERVRVGRRVARWRKGIETFGD